MKITDKIEISQEDNMELMKRYPDGYFDLAFNQSLFTPEELKETNTLF